MKVFTESLHFVETTTVLTHKQTTLHAVLTKQTKIDCCGLPVVELVILLYTLQPALQKVLLCNENEGHINMKYNILDYNHQAKACKSNEGLQNYIKSLTHSFGHEVA